MTLPAAEPPRRMCPFRPTSPCPWEPDEVQRTLLRLVAQGLTDRQIAAETGFSRHTIAHHISALSRLASKRNRTALAAWAGYLGLSDDAPDQAEA